MGFHTTVTIYDGDKINSIPGLKEIFHEYVYRIKEIVLNGHVYYICCCGDMDEGTDDLDKLDRELKHKYWNKETYDWDYPETGDPVRQINDAEISSQTWSS